MTNQQALLAIFSPTWVSVTGITNTKGKHLNKDADNNNKEYVQ